MFIGLMSGGVHCALLIEIIMLIYSSISESFHVKVYLGCL